ncbi:hypothetical protein BS47DRAFT_730530 [Hydnum rufescens UP504]|uniref:Uncharacterized protein n=1 Tax=Hydnum rufescens UP504 TaxID=1448309 RepID=A0A9P6B1Y5_9AGAM|nr:hypothetical protein BS47DRAFT_730530 [Hydnum rufescens UP504]
MLAPLAVLGSVALLAAAAPAPQPYEVGSLNATITYTPDSSWGTYIAPGGFQTEANTSVAVFSTKQTNLSAVNWTTPYPTVTFQWWGYQRSDGGNATVSIDDSLVQVVDYYNKSSPGTAFPVLLYSVASLSPAVHRIYIRNQFDARGTFGSGYGEINVDHFVVIPVDAATTSSAVSTSTSSSSSSSPSATTSSATPTPAVRSSNNHAGAIAGGVVGGVVGLAS